MQTRSRSGLRREPNSVGTIDERPATSSDPDALWARAAALLRTQLPDGQYALCFGDAHPDGMPEGVLRLEVANPVARDCITTRHRAAVADALRLAAGRPVEFEVVVAASKQGPPVAAEPPERGPRKAADTARAPGCGFSDRYQFESFVIGSSNRFAHAAALAVSEGPAQGYNPLFIYGGAGLGKTHLLHAIGNSLVHRRPALAVRYVSSEQFVNEFIAAVQRRSIPEFHSRYRQADVLLIDDIQFLESKERTQEEFFHTFNALHPESQIVITSDRSPHKIAALEDRLRTRFLWGLIADVQPPDFETRLAILHKQVEAQGLAISDEVLTYIAERVQTNIRELEGALLRVTANASLMKSPVTLAHARSALEYLLSEPHSDGITADLVMSITADYFGVTTDAVKSPSRSRPLVHARQIAMALCRKLTPLSYPHIGQRFGGRDHSTVLHAVNKISAQNTRGSRTSEQLQELTARIRQQAARAHLAHSHSFDD